MSPAAHATASSLCCMIRYEVRGPLPPVRGVHCTRCRKTSGHHVRATFADLTHVTIHDRPCGYTSSETAERGFCPTCGFNLFWRRADHWSIFGGSLDSHTDDLTLAGHIFYADKGRYYEIANGTMLAPGDDPNLAPAAR